MRKKERNFISTPIKWESDLDRIQFALKLAITDLSGLSVKRLSQLRKRFSEFLGYVETQAEEYGHIAGYAGVAVSGIRVHFAGRFENREPDEYQLTDFLRLQEKARRILKEVSRTTRKVLKFGTRVAFQNVAFSFFAGGVTVDAENPDDAFVIITLLLLNRWEHSSRVWECVYCQNPFYKTKRQKYCKDCKTRADRERVRRWRKIRANRIKEGARAAQKRLRMRAKK